MNLSNTKVRFLIEDHERSIEIVYKIIDFHSSDELIESLEKEYNRLSHSLSIVDWTEIPECAIMREKDPIAILGSLYELYNNVGCLPKEQHEAFFLWAEYYRKDIETESIPKLVARFESQYMGYYYSMEEFAEDMAYKYFDLDEEDRRFFDFEQYTEDLEYHYTEINGFIFRD